MNRLFVAFLGTALVIGGARGVVASGEKEAVVSALGAAAQTLRAAGYALSWGDIETGGGGLFTTDVTIHDVTLEVRGRGTVMTIASVAMTDVDAAPDGDLDAMEQLQLSGLTLSADDESVGVAGEPHRAAIRGGLDALTVTEPNVAAILALARGERDLMEIDPVTAFGVFEAETISLSALSFDAWLAADGARAAPPQPVMGRSDVAIRMDTLAATGIGGAQISDLTIGGFTSHSTLGGPRQKDVSGFESLRLTGADFRRAFAEVAAKGDRADLFTLVFGMTIADAEMLKYRQEAPWFNVTAERFWSRHTPASSAGAARSEFGGDALVWTPSRRNPFALLIRGHFGGDGAIRSSMRGAMTYDLDRRFLALEGSIVYEQLFTVVSDVSLSEIAEVPLSDPGAFMRDRAPSARRTASGRWVYTGGPLLEAWGFSLEDHGIREVVFAIIGAFSDPPKTTDLVAVDLADTLDAQMLTMSKPQPPELRVSSGAIKAFILDGGTLAFRSRGSERLSKATVDIRSDSLDTVDVTVTHTPAN